MKSDRDRLREKQDKLLVRLNGHYAETTHLSAAFQGTPTIAQMRTMIFPEWEWLIDEQIEHWN